MRAISLRFTTIALLVAAVLGIGISFTPLPKWIATLIILIGFVIAIFWFVQIIRFLIGRQRQV